MPYNLKTLQLIRLVFANAALSPCYIDLILYSINSVKIRQQQTSLITAGYYNSIALYVKLRRRIDIFCIRKHVYAYIKIFKFTFSNRVKTRILGTCAHGILNNLFGSLYTTVNMTILGFYVTDTIVGYFSAAQKLIMALIMVVVLPVSISVFPEISKRFEASREGGLAFLKRVMVYAGLAALMVSIATYFIAPIAIRIVYGVDFTEAIAVLKWLAPIPFLVMMATLLTIQGLYGIGLQRYAPWIGLTLAVVCITMNIVLIPRMGIAAVCISWITSEVLECVLSGTILMIKGMKRDK